jgi:hypothetical protein
MFEHTVNGDINGMLWGAIRRRDASRYRGVDLEVVAPETRIDLEKEALAFGFVAASRRLILTEFFGGQIGGDECFRDQREIQMCFHNVTSFSNEGVEGLHL